VTVNSELTVTFYSNLSFEIWDWDSPPTLILKPDCTLGAIKQATSTTEAERIDQMQHIIFKLPGFEEATFPLQNQLLFIT